jgi:hypothetical protein
VALADVRHIRERCQAVAALVDQGLSAHFTLDRAQLPAVAERVARVTRSRHPDGKIPLHSRWRHFNVGGVDRKALLDAKLAARTSVAVTRARIELAFISVLLDAGAGPDWHYDERETGQRFTRSEGLAVATFRAFMAGKFSSDVGDPCRVDAKALLRIEPRTLAEIFQASDANPIVGLEGRAALLRRLGEALRARPDLFTADGLPGHLFDALTHHRHVHHLPHTNLHHVVPGAFRHHVASARILELLLEAFDLGDVGPHAQVGAVPFHKLSQWLTYSLIEPLEWGGVAVNDLDDLTALPEYRNGGLLLDAGVIVPRDAGYAQRSYRPTDEWVVEWRALTVALLDELAPLVRERLGLEQLTLARLLEGGTWAAGREIAAEKRPGGAPPVRIESDGTVF